VGLDDVLVAGVTSLSFLRWMRDEKRVPWPTQAGATYPPSTSELVRWLRSGSVVVDGRTLGERDEVEFPMREVVFFPRSRRKTTMPGFGEAEA
jgi:hypothetical protein